MATFLITKVVDIEGVGNALTGRIIEGIINAGDIAVIRDGNEVYYLKIQAVGNAINRNPDWMHCALKISDTDRLKIEDLDIEDRYIEVFERRHLGADLDALDEDIDLIDYIQRDVLDRPLD